MYLEHFGFSEKPFRLKPDARFYHPAPTHQAAQNSLGDAIAKQAPVVLLTGPAGSGKSTLIRRVLARLEGSVRVLQLSHTTLSFQELIEQLADMLDLESSDGNVGDRIQRLQKMLTQDRQRGLSTVVVIDDAHNLDRGVIEDILSLSRRDGGFGPAETLFTALLTGLPQLAERVVLADDNPVHVELRQLDAEQVDAYIRHQLSSAGYQRQSPFTPNSMETLVELSRGNPRTINSLCDAALFIAAMEEQHYITPEILDRAAQQCFLKQPDRVNYFDHELAAARSDTPLQPRNLTGLTDRDARQALGLRLGDVSAELAAAGVDSAAAELPQSPDRGEHPAESHAGSDAIADRADNSDNADADRTLVMTATVTGAAADPGARRDDPLDQIDAELDAGLEAGIHQGVEPRPQTAAALAAGRAERNPHQARPRAHRRWPARLALLALVLVLAGGAVLGFAPQWLGMDREQIQGYLNRLSGPADSLSPAATAPDAEPGGIETPLSARPEPGLSNLDDSVSTDAEPLSSPASPNPERDRADDTPSSDPAPAIVANDEPAPTEDDTDRQPVSTLDSLLQPGPVTAGDTPSSGAGDSVETAAAPAAPGQQPAPAGETPPSPTELPRQTAAEALAAFEAQREDPGNGDLPDTSTAPDPVASVTTALQTDAPATAETPAQQNPPPTTDANPAGQVDLERRAEIDRLLARAERQVADNLLTTPADDNAFDSYQAVLELVPQEPRALAGLELIKRRYQSWASVALARGNPQRAQDYYRKALRVAPGDEELLEALREIDRRLGDSQ